eukprot:3989203-Amphidinium_carterae.3
MHVYNLHCRMVCHCCVWLILTVTRKLRLISVLVSGDFDTDLIIRGWGAVQRNPEPCTVEWARSEGLCRPKMHHSAPWRRLERALFLVVLRTRYSGRQQVYQHTQRGWQDARTTAKESQGSRPHTRTTGLAAAARELFKLNRWIQMVALLCQEPTCCPQPKEYADATTL